MPAHWHCAQLTLHFSDFLEVDGGQCDKILLVKCLGLEKQIGGIIS